MKLIHLLLPALLLLTSCKKEKPADPVTGPTYHTYPGKIGVNDNSTLVSFDNNLLICGNSGDSIVVLKTSKAGNLLWRRKIYAGFHSSASAIAESSGQEVFICGSAFSDPNNSINDVLLVKTDINGDTVWTKKYGGPKDDFGMQIIATKDGNMLICGTSYSYTSDPFSDVYLLKVTTNGDTLWTRTYHNQNTEIPYHLMETMNGVYLVTGIHSDDTFTRSIYLLAADQNGNKLWDRKIGDSAWVQGNSTIELPNGDLMICGARKNNVLLVRTDMNGNDFWEREYIVHDDCEGGYSLKQDSDNTFTILGSYLDVASFHEVFLMKVALDGSQLWLKTFGGQAEDWGRNLIKDANDDNIITGTTFSYGPDAYKGNIFMTRIDKNGSFR